MNINEAKTEIERLRAALETIQAEAGKSADRWLFHRWCVFR